MNKYQKLNQSFINGKWVDGLERETVDIHNPYNEDVLASVSIASLQQVDEAFEGAHKAQRTWGKNAKLRKEVLTKAVNYFKDYKADILEILTLESGSTSVKAHLEYDLTLGVMETSLTMVDKIGKFDEKTSIIPHKINEYYRLPKGVIASIAPFNFPLYLSMRTIAPGLALGNAIVHKADLQCGLASGSLIAKAFEVSGLPAGVFQSILTNPHVIKNKMFEHPLANLVSFTGSTPVGRMIGEVAGKHLKDVSLELGGNAPFCVMKDASIEQAVRAAIFGKFLHQGQICMMTNRFIVHEEVYDEFTTKFVARAKHLKYGDPLDPNVIVGPLINKEQMDKSLNNIQIAKEAGYDLLLEGEQVGNILTPTVIGNAANDSDLVQSEMFSPIALIVKGSSDEDIIAKANDTEFGLSSAIFSEDEEKARQHALDLKFGMTHINDQPVNDEPNAMFGGMRQSGIGRFGNPYIIDEFTEGKWISRQTRPREFPF